ncbi:hypothetical protein [Rhizobium sp. AN95]|uniref:hypothetical protein n=1 Tax=Rhizobium sp. AN95 TaxID=3035216 RepID=UPI002B25F4D0|nr:hypothetical protein [Rhizobium sp. AN95]
MADIDRFSSTAGRNSIFWIGLKVPPHSIAVALSAPDHIYGDHSAPHPAGAS